MRLRRRSSRQASSRVPSRPRAIKAECHRGPPMVRPEAPSSLLFTIAPENGRGFALGPASLGQSASGEALLLLLHYCYMTTGRPSCACFPHRRAAAIRRGAARRARRLDRTAAARPIAVHAPSATGGAFRRAASRAAASCHPGWETAAQSARRPASASLYPASTQPRPILVGMQLADT